jgi:hypothetical protein
MLPAPTSLTPTLSRRARGRTFFLFPCSSLGTCSWVEAPASPSTHPHPVPRLKGRGRFVHGRRSASPLSPRERARVRALPMKENIAGSTFPHPDPLPEGEGEGLFSFPSSSLGTHQGQKLQLRLNPIPTLSLPLKGSGRFRSRATVRQSHLRRDGATVRVPVTNQDIAGSTFPHPDPLPEGEGEDLPPHFASSFKP